MKFTSFHLFYSWINISISDFFTYQSAPFARKVKKPRETPIVERMIEEETVRVGENVAEEWERLI